MYPHLRVPSTEVIFLLFRSQKFLNIYLIQWTEPVDETTIKQLKCATDTITTVRLTQKLFILQEKKLSATSSQHKLTLET